MITSNDVLTVIAVGCAVSAAILLILAIAGARHARRAAYYAIRRQSQQHANRRFAWALGLFAASAGVLILSRIMPQAELILERVPVLPNGAGLSPERTTAQAWIVATPSPTTLKSVSPVSTLTGTAPKSNPTAATASASPSVVSTPALTSTLAPPTPTPAAATATSTGPLMVLRAIGAGVDPSGQPISTTTEFTSSPSAVYVFFDHGAIPPGTLIRQNWFLDGASVHFATYPWDKAGHGSAYIAWVQRRPFPAGTYEVRVFAENRLEFIANFVVR